VALVCAGICLTAGLAYAGNITIHDGFTGVWGFNTTDAVNSYGSGRGSTNVGSEDNETEWNTVSNQSWDLEGMFLEGDTLSLVGGWDFINGNPGGGASQAGDDNQYTSGDIFIALTTPLYGTGAPVGENADDWFYSYVIDVDWLNGTYSVYSGVDQPIDTVSFTQNDGANPWVMTGGGDEIASGSFISDTWANTGAAEYVFQGQTANNTHNFVSFDLSWLYGIVDDGDDIWFHFTQECGNDNLMGFTNELSPTPAVPEPASIGLLGLGLVGLVTARIRTKRA
jgi:hypothetical protein